MFANLLPFRNPGDHDAHERAFVREVKVKQPVQRNRRSEWLLIIGWALIALKCSATVWVVNHYQMPFSAWWIVLPTLAAAGLCTWVYLRRN